MTDFSTENHFSTIIYTKSLLSIHTTHKSLDIAPSAMAILTRMKELCYAKGVNLHLMVTPNYIWDNYRLLSLGYWPALNNFVEELSKHKNVWSFSQFNQITSEPPGPDMIWWYDPIHFSSQVGQMMQAALFEDSDDHPSSFAIRLNSENVSTLMSQRKSDVEEWARNHEFATHFEQVRIEKYPNAGHEQRAELQTSEVVLEQERKAQIHVNARKQDLIAANKLSSSAVFSSEGVELGGILYRFSNQHAGVIESATFSPAGLNLSGWAVDQRANQPVEALLVVSGDKILHMDKTEVPRSDIQAGLAPGVANSGYLMDVGAQVLAGFEPNEIRVYGVLQNQQLSRLVTPKPLDFGTWSIAQYPAE